MTQNIPNIVGGAVNRSLRVTYVHPSELTPDVRNARTHSKRQIEQLKSAITSFGFTNPILVDEAGLLIAGHGRLRAAKELDMAEVPTIVLVDLSEGQKRLLRLADNKIALARRYRATVRFILSVWTGDT